MSAGIHEPPGIHTCCTNLGSTVARKVQPKLFVLPECMGGLMTDGLTSTNTGSPKRKFVLSITSWGRITRPLPALVRFFTAKNNERAGPDIISFCAFVAVGQLPFAKLFQHRCPRRAARMQTGCCMQQRQPVLSSGIGAERFKKGPELVFEVTFRTKVNHNNVIHFHPFL